MQNAPKLTTLLVLTLKLVFQVSCVISQSDNRIWLFRPVVLESYFHIPPLQTQSLSIPTQQRLQMIIE